MELIGDDSSAADGEMIAMVIEALKAAGLKEFQVELGQVEFFKGLAEEAGMEEETQETLRTLIENKNYFGVEELVSESPMPQQLKELFLKLPELFGTLEQMRRVKGLVHNERSLKAIERLERVQEILKTYGMAEYVSYDLGMLSKYQYYTGIIFKAYTYGTGEYIVTGGRYDKLLVQFGKDVPAVGFAIVIDQLLLAISRQKIEVFTDQIDALVVYDWEVQKDGIGLAADLRKKGKRTILIKKSSELSFQEYEDWARKKGIQTLYCMEKNGERRSLCLI